MSYFTEEKKLDILINNAGIVSPEANTKTEDGFEPTFGVNHLGKVVILQLLW